MSLPLKSLQETARIIRGLSADAVQKANSGHPGLPLGCAEMGAALYGYLLNHNPAEPEWPNRDRFILSAGHGSMLQYACLHLSGYDVSLDDLKNFRQWESKTPGHPEFGDTAGVECTTGPLGQGIANGVGMALGAKIKASKFNTDRHKLISHQVVVLCGDGCLMEGISYEAISLAGHLKLDNFILIYDSNDISLDAPTSVSFTEDTVKRFEACGFFVITVDGHNVEEFSKAYEKAQSNVESPSIIIAKTTIGKGSPNKQGSEKAHGAPLGEEEVGLMKSEVGLPQDQSFYISDDVTSFFKSQRSTWHQRHQDWLQLFHQWQQANPELKQKWERDHNFEVSDDFFEKLPKFEVGESIATRKASNKILQVLSQEVSHLIGGSADLSCSNLTNIDKSKGIQAGRFLEKNIFYGVREHAMAAICNGLSYYGGHLPYCGTFLVFADYMRPAIRLAALTQRQVLFIFTHDSFMVGEDGPTHQPVEILASLRCVPGLTTYRPADANETVACYFDALKQKGPVALCLTRQGVETLSSTNVKPQEGVSRGAYLIYHEKDPSVIDHLIMASGSEVSLALEVAQQLETRDLSVRVVSIPSFERFEAQSKSYRQEILGRNVKNRWALEAQVSFGWHRYIGREGKTITMETFGASAPGKVLQEKFGFTANQVISQMMKQNNFEKVL